MRAILTYHSVDPSGSPISISEGQLREHIRWLASATVQAVPLEWLLKVPEDRDAVAITIDDGFKNFVDIAWPLFKHFDVPVTLFIASERVGTNNQWEDRPTAGIPTLPLASWEELRRLVERGLGIGSHSRTHARLTGLDDSALAREIVESKREIGARLGVEPKGFCYPYGDHDERVVNAVRAHYEVAVTTELAVLGPQPDAHRLPRLDAYYFRDNHKLQRWDSGGFHRHVKLRALGRRLRGIFGR